MEEPILSGNDKALVRRLITTGPAVSNLATELVCMICEYLDDADILQFRLACRAFKNTSLFTFGSRFFDKLEATMHEQSLNVLNKISRHGELSLFVREITLHSQCEPRNQYTDTRNQTFTIGYNFLASSFKNFKQLRSVRIFELQTQDNKVFPSESTKCGFRQISELPLSVISYTIRFPRVCDFVFRALCHYGQGRNIDLLVYPYFQFYRSFKEPFDLTSSIYGQFVARNLHTLDFYTHEWFAVGDTWLEKVLLTAKNLQQLGLADEYPRYSGSQSIKPFAPRSLSPSVLRRLFLNHAKLYCTSLTTMLQQCRTTLNEVTMVIVGLMGGNWIKPLDALSTCKNLEILHLQTLIESEPFENIDGNHNHIETLSDCYGLCASDKESISRGLSALRSDIRTQSSNYWGLVDIYLIALWKAQAAAMGLVECIDGEWDKQFLDKESNVTKQTTDDSSVISEST